ncbi:MAG TPA: ferritin-like domain-containing protein [Gammaproteobacteria bacterium]|nr:ferritin-like domain-containing protein [Gammaproteobacteria bacterium]
MAEPATRIGSNRTGIQASPFDMQKLEEIASKAPARPAEELKASSMRQDFMKHTEGFGSVAPPGSVKGMATTAMEAIKGHKPATLIDKLGERLAFERSGVRAYEAVLVKFDALGTWEGGPSHDLLLHQRDEELEHFNMLTDIIEQLGADPTTMTPSADLASLAGSGVFKVLGDPRTTLPQALQALQILEITDLEGWIGLIDLADGIGQQELATKFRQAQETEETHQARVREWLSKATLADANRELGEQGTMTS